MPNPTNVQEFAVHSEYVTDTGVRGMGTAGPVGATQLTVVQLFHPKTFRVVTWKTMAVGDFPYVPDPDSGNVNEILMMKRLGNPMVSQAQDSTKIVSLAGQYTYLCLLPPSDTDQLLLGKYPYGNLQAADAMFVPKNYFSQDILPTVSVASPFTGFPFAVGDGGLLTGGNQPFVPKLP